VRFHDPGSHLCSYSMELKRIVAKIKALNPGFGYKKIARLAGCSPSTVVFHLNPESRNGHRHRQSRNRASNTEAIKTLFGGKCLLCGYDKCYRALSFHHISPNDKVGCVNRILADSGKAAAIKEALKCALICANCHMEIHTFPELMERLNVLYKEKAHTIPIS